MSHFSLRRIRRNLSHVIREQPTGCCGFFMLVLGAITLSSCAFSTMDVYDGPKRSAAELAFVQAMLDYRTLVNGHNIYSCAMGANSDDNIGIHKIDGSEPSSVTLATKVRVLPGLHSFEVETSHVSSSSSTYLPGTSAVGRMPATPGTFHSHTQYTKERWLVTFPVTAGSTYQIVRAAEMGLPPSVYRIGDPSDVGKMPGTHTYRSYSKALSNLRDWYSKQEEISPSIRKFVYEKGRQPSEWYLPESEAK